MRLAFAPEEAGRPVRRRSTLLPVTRLLAPATGLAVLGAGPAAPRRRT